MDWLNNLTKTLTLKKAFFTYLTISLIAAFILSGVLESLISSSIFLRQDSYFEESISDDKTTYTYVEDPIAQQLNSISRGFNKFISEIVTSIFLLISFQLFYIHKLRPPIEGLGESLENISLSNQDELSLSVIELSKLIKTHQEISLIGNYRQHEFKINIATLVHGIKNPLTVLKGNIEMLAQLPSDQEELYNELLVGLEVNTARIESYVEKLKSDQSLNSDSLTLSTIFPLQFESNLENNLQTTHTTIDINFINSQSLKELKLDTFKMQESLDAILENCLRYANESIAITFKEEINYYAISIEDDGPGFSSISLQQASNRYFSENPGVDNMGLGLFFAKTIVELHHGKFLLSNHEKGAKIKIFLPFL